MINTRLSELKLSEMTASQFVELMQSNGIINKQVEETPAKRYVYGLDGIASLFGVSHVTAQRYKQTILKEACIQHGRKIVVDAEKAMELFNQRRAAI